MKSTEKTGTNALIFIGSGILLLSSVALAYILSVHSKLRRASEPGRVVSATVTSSDRPLTTFTHSGQHGDPINIQFVGTNGQVGAAFAAAGWYRADEISFITSVRICVDSVLGRKYSTAPVSNLYLYGRKEDMAFERPGSSARQRDHIRIWNTGRNGNNRRHVWIGSATKDIRIELAKTNHMPTHHISSDVDAERALVTSELMQTGYVIQETTRPGFGKQTNALNGGGDPYFTDGQVAVLTLANVVTPPLAAHVHSPMLASITKQLTGFVLPLLPQARHKQGQQIT